MDDSDKTKLPAGQVGSARNLPPRELRSEDLLAGATEVWILHRGETYRLRETRNGKLILIK